MVKNFFNSILTHIKIIKKYFVYDSISFKDDTNESKSILHFSFLLSFIMLIYVITGKIHFSQKQLKETAEFTINLVFAISALGISIFTLPIKRKITKKKKKIMLNYLGTCLYITSVSILTYILSFCTFFNITIIKKFDIFSLYFCVMLFMICKSMLYNICATITYLKDDD